MYDLPDQVVWFSIGAMLVVILSMLCTKRGLDFVPYGPGRMLFVATVAISLIGLGVQIRKSHMRNTFGGPGAVVLYQELLDCRAKHPTLTCELTIVPQSPASSAELTK